MPFPFGRIKNRVEGCYYCALSSNARRVKCDDCTIIDDQIAGFDEFLAEIWSSKIIQNILNIFFLNRGNIFLSRFYFLNYIYQNNRLTIINYQVNYLIFLLNYKTKFFFLSSYKINSIFYLVWFCINVHSSLTTYNHYRSITQKSSTINKFSS